MKTVVIESFPVDQPMENADMTPEDLEDRLGSFAVRIGNVVDRWADSPVGRYVAGQIVWSGTSAASNYAERCAAASRTDFVHKLSIPGKELRETKFWLRTRRKANVISAVRLGDIVEEADRLCAILSRSIHTPREGSHL